MFETETPEKTSRPKVYRQVIFGLMKRNQKHEAIFTAFREIPRNSSRVKRGLSTSVVVTSILISLVLLWIWTKVRFTSQTQVQDDVPDWLVPKSEVHINPHPYKLTINHKHVCGSATLSLLVAVASSPSNEDRRDAIRRSWALNKHKHARVRVLFFLGLSKDASIEEKIARESDIHKDIIQEDFIDAYVNLTIKSVMALRWTASFCPMAQHFFKTDDDVFVNLPRLVEYVEHEGRPNWIAGCIKQKKLPRPISLNGAPVPDFGHPPFVAGAGYVISGDLIVPLFRASLRMPYLPIEDVFITAHCARALGVHPQHHDGFTCGERLRADCHVTRHFTAHHITPEKQLQLWKLVIDPERPCDG